MRNQEIKQFKRYLKEHGVYSAYIKNYDPKFAEDFFNNKSTSLEEFLKQCKGPGDFITFAFYYMETKEGGAFWCDISMGWQEFLRVNK